ncbi:MAG: O-antigen ligase family protein [Candidatus Fermentibacteraceae bacterium]|nr:O-antigen ligase family protein [Candidatus Fermentibacteraceae bacterium]MBN2609230.1 O-antigen ligase family protein [Candidatus Fermentibacteraceae bacterium]
MTDIPGIPRRVEEFTSCRLGLRGVLLLLLGTGCYFGLRLYFPPVTRYLIIGCSAFAILFFLRPYPRFWLLLLPVMFIMGGSTIPTGEFNPAITTIVMIAFTVFFFIDRIVWNRPLFVPSPYLFWIFAAVLIQVCSVFISIHIHGQYPWNAIREGSGIYLFLPMAVMVPVLCPDRDCLMLLLKAVVVSLLIASAIGVAQYFSITDFSRVDLGLGYLYRGRVASLFGNGNIFSGYLELSIPMAIALFFRERSARWRTAALLAVVLGVLSVLYTFSRGGLVCVAVGCGITLMYIFRSKPWIPVLLGALAILLLIQYGDTFDRQLSFFTDPQKQITQPTILHRYVSYQGFIEQIKDSPVTGVGWGAEEYFWGRSRLYSFWEVRHTVSTGTIRLFGGLNSLFFNQAVKGGLVSIMALLILIASIFAAFIRAMRVPSQRTMTVAVMAGIFGFMIHQLVDNLLQFPTVSSLFWISVGIMLAIASGGLEEGGQRPSRTCESREALPVSPASS